jgi:hypothetical protein
MLKTVDAFREPYEAYIARGKLEVEGIPATIADDHLVQMDWRYSQAIGGVKLQVPEEFLEKAQQILTETQAEEDEKGKDAIEETDEEEVCPKCGSSLTSPRRFSLTSIAISLVLLLPFFYRKDGRVCRNCGTVWRNKNS